MARKITLALIVAVGLATLSGLFVARLRYSHLQLKTCFDDAQGLRAGASVQIAGVDVGIVRSVRADPQNKGCPAEVEMDIATTYELKVPRDSIARLARGGLLGPTYVNLDITQASGSPIEKLRLLEQQAHRSVRSPDQAIRKLGSSSPIFSRKFRHFRRSTDVPIYAL